MTIFRPIVAITLLASSASFISVSSIAGAQSAPVPEQVPSTAPRAIRRDISLTNMIRRAWAAGTRDSTGRPGRNYWQLWNEYSINARFDPATSTITGREHVLVHNNSDSAMRTIVLRLDQNIYAANVPRAETVPEITDGMLITRLAINGADVDLTDRSGAAGRTPRGAPQPPLTRPVATGITQTVATVRLPAPIAPKTTVTIDADWHFRVPLVNGVRGLRMGRWADSLYQVGQWYPRVAVFDDLRGWDTDPYLGPAEFYNNYGHFDVHLDMPAGWLVGATGVLQNPEQVLTPTMRERLSHVLESDSTRSIVSAAERGPGKSTVAGDRLVWHFVADTVGDVAWATSDRFVWDATRATIPGKGAIPVNIMYEPGRTAAYAPAGPTARHALEFYSKLWMPYAYPVLTMVDGPEGGMEYPMFIMSSTGAADHETGHQWWPMMVGVNETWYGFMDEGFNQYMNRLSRSDRLNQAPDLDSLGQSYGRISGDEREAPLMWDENYGGPLYSFEAYGKAPLMLSMLGGVVGDSAVWHAMSDYAKAWRFKHPTPWDYALFMDHALNKDLTWFWYPWLFTTESVDGSIASVRTAGRRTTVTVREDGAMPSPVVLRVKLAGTGPAVHSMPNARMVDPTTAIVTWPVDVWFSGSRTFDAVLDFGGRAIESVEFDPGRRFPDRDPSDNIWPRSAGSTSGSAGSTRQQ
ncbi:MAG: M1 family metallopeptidase [Gemmatimonadaceae bacterium]